LEDTFPEVTRVIPGRSYPEKSISTREKTNSLGRKLLRGGKIKSADARRNRFFQTYRVAGHRFTRSLVLAMARTDYPRKLTESVAEFLQKMLFSQQ
jgi:hypothetical protein